MTEVVVVLIDVLLLVVDTRVGDVIVSSTGVLLLALSTSSGDVTMALTGGLWVVTETLSLTGLSDHVFPFVVAVLLR